MNWRTLMLAGLVLVFLSCAVLGYYLDHLRFVRCVP